MRTNFVRDDRNGSDDGDITHELLCSVEMRDCCAEIRLWNTCFDRVSRLIARWEGARRRRVVDEQDLAVDTLDRLFRLIHAGVCVEIRTAGELQSLVRHLARRCFLSQLRREMRLKHGAKRMDFGSATGLELLPGGVAPNYEAFEEGDELLALLRLPEDNRLWAILNLCHSGYSRPEIATALKISVSTVNRHLRELHARWQRRRTAGSSSKGRGVFFLNGIGIRASARRPPPPLKRIRKNDRCDASRAMSSSRSAEALTLLARPMLGRDIDSAGRSGDWTRRS